MAFSQIATSVTIINSGLIGYMGISLTEMGTSAASLIASGSCVEIAGAFFKADSDVTPNASSLAALSAQSVAYLYLTPSGTVGTQILTAAWSATAPTWSTSKQGWYASAVSAVRAVAGIYKHVLSRYYAKCIIPPLTVYNYDGRPIITQVVEIGSWDMDATTSSFLYLYPALDNRIVSIDSVVIQTDSLQGGLPLDFNGNGYYYISSGGTLNLNRLTGGAFDSTTYNDAAVNRGWVKYSYVL